MEGAGTLLGGLIADRCHRLGRLRPVVAVVRSATRGA